MKTIITTLLLIISVTFGMAQYTINGKVTDDKNNPLADVNILIKNTSKGIETDKEGVFELGNLKSGNYKLLISIVGYKTKQINVALSNKNKTISTVKLVQQNNQLNEVLINGGGIKIKQKHLQLLYV